MDISSLYTDLYSKEASNAKSKKLSNSVNEESLKGATDEELMDVCKQFESYFVEQVLKQSMSTFTQGDTSESGSMNTLTNYYKDSLITEYAGKITDREDLGLAKTLYEQMKRNLSPNVIPPAKVIGENNENTEKSDTDLTSAKEAVSTTQNKEE